MGEDKNKNIQQLELQSKQYSKQIEDRSAEYFQEAETARLEIERIKSKLKTLEANLVLYQESLKISQDRLKEGQITSIELNEQEYELQQLLAEYESSRKQMWLFILSQLKASGQLSRLWT